MKSVFVLVGAIATLVTVSAPMARWIPRAEADDRVFGWMKVYNLGSATKPLTVDHRVYSTAHLTVANNLRNWIQQSYVPVGGLGDVLQWVSDKMSPYNQDTKSLPPTYGAYAKIYTDLKPGVGGKIEPATNGHYFWSIRVNAVYGEPANSSSARRSSTTSRSRRWTNGRIDGAELEKAADLSQHPVLGRFPCVLYDGRKFVVLARGNRLPFVKLTKGEYLDALGAAIAVPVRARTHPNHGSEAGRQGPDRSGHGVPWTSGRRSVSRHSRSIASDTRAACRKSRRSPTSNRTSSSRTSPDVFLGSGGSRIHIPVYKVDPALAELAQDGRAAVDRRRVEQRAARTPRASGCTTPSSTTSTSSSSTTTSSRPRRSKAGPMRRSAIRRRSSRS